LYISQISLLVNLEKLHLTIQHLIRFDEDFNDFTSLFIDAFNKVCTNCAKLKYLYIFFTTISCEYRIKYVSLSVLFESISKLSQLNTLNIICERNEILIDENITSKSLAKLTNLTQLSLTVVSLDDNFFTDIHIHLPNLISLKIRTLPANITDQLLMHLTNLKLLRKLILEDIRLRSCLNISDTAIIDLVHCCSSLRVLKVILLESISTEICSRIGNRINFINW
jgi:hypothetical protein